MEEVALCFRFMDLLLHDLVGEGMEEEISCWPLRLLGTEPPPEQLPFIPPGNGIPLNASGAGEKRGTGDSQLRFHGY